MRAAVSLVRDHFQKSSMKKRKESVRDISFYSQVENETKRCELTSVFM